MLKKTVIKITETVFLAMFLLSVFACSISFAETVHSYNISKTENDSVVAELEATNDNTYILTISGNGFMKSFDNNPEWYADYSDKISSVVVEAGIKNIGTNVFAGMSALTKVTLPEGLDIIESNAFDYKSSLEEITIPKSVTKICDNAFGGSTILTVDILGNNTEVELSDPLWGQIAKKVIAFEDSKTVQEWVYEAPYPWNPSQTQPTRTELEKKDSYIYNSDHTSVSKYIANGSSITVPDGVTKIENETFANNDSITSVHLNEVTSIGDKAFMNCKALTKVTIPSSVTTIASDAFQGCDNVTIYCNSGSVAETFAIDNDFPVIIMKPYRNKELNPSLLKTITTDDEDVIALNDVFTTDYISVLSYQFKIDNEEFMDMDGSSYVFSSNTDGQFSVTFRAKDADGTLSEDEYTVEYTVVSNAAPVLDPDKKEQLEYVLFGERIDVDLNGVFTDPDDDELQYRYVNSNDVSSEDEIDWTSSNKLTVENNKFKTPNSWTQYPSDINKEHVFYIKAFDKWNKPSDEVFKMILKMHSINILVTKGAGVYSLEGIQFNISRDGAESIVVPSEQVDDNYYFDLDYVIDYPYGPDMPVYRGGYDYTYEISLDGCETISGKLTSTRSANKADNTYEISLTNPEQAAKDEQSIAAVKDLIDKLGEVTLDSEDAINAAQKAYNDLYDDLKPQVTNYSTLLQARLTLADLKLEAAKKDLKEAEKAKAELDGVKEELAALKLTVKGLKVTSKKKKFTVKWKKNAKASGYTVQYKLSGAKKFKTLKTLTKTKVVSKKLKKGKKYEFRVATYKKVKGKKVFGKWTEAKIVKCK